MNEKSKGQILVILAVAMVAILAVTALAVDGSMIYNERRKDQTIADSVALAAANEASKSTVCATARTAALSKAISFASTQEGTTLANDSTSPNRVEATCSGDSKTLDIKVSVSTTTPTTFAKMISRDQLVTNVSATPGLLLAAACLPTAARYGRQDRLVTPTAAFGYQAQPKS